MKLLSFGEIIWDVFPTDKHIGGAPLNLAAHVARQSENSAILSSVGNDSLGREALEEIKKFGVNCDFVTMSDSRPTGSCVVTLDENAVPHYDLKKDTAYDAITLPNKIENEKFDFLTFGTLALRDAVSRESLKKLISMKICDKIYADINIRPPFFSKESVLICFENADIIKISDEELPTVLDVLSLQNDGNTENAAKTLSKSFENLRYIIITLGAKGSLCYDTENKAFHIAKAPNVPVVSTVGAGDSFGATFLVEYSRGKSIDKCLEKASEISAFVVTKTEAVPNY